MTDEDLKGLVEKRIAENKMSAQQRQTLMVAWITALRQPRRESAKKNLIKALNYPD